MERVNHLHVIWRNATSKPGYVREDPSHRLRLRRSWHVHVVQHCMFLHYVLYLLEYRSTYFLAKACVTIKGQLMTVTKLVTSLQLLCSQLHHRLTCLICRICHNKPSSRHFYAAVWDPCILLPVPTQASPVQSDTRSSLTPIISICSRATTSSQAIIGWYKNGHSQFCIGFAACRTIA